MLVIGLTGGIGTGKTEVSRILQDLGAALINADTLGHQVYLPGSEAWRAVVAAFGEKVLQPNGQIDRKRLGSIVFSDPRARAELDSIMHPKMAKMAIERIEEFRRQGAPVVVVEAALLIEAGWDSMVDEVWVTTASRDKVMERLAQRNHLPKEEIQRRIDAQLSFDEKVKRSQVIIDNSTTLEELRSKLVELWNSRVKGKVV